MRDNLTKIFLSALMVSCLFLSSCSTNSATGEKQFTGFMPEASEQRIGAQEHAKILKQYGVVEDESIKAMVNEIGNRLVPHTERANVKYTFTVLDTPDVNAFALPGGFIYVTRGLLALANSEAEVAAVVGHEIGHVTARHSAERYSQSVVTGLGATVLAVLLDDQNASRALGLGSTLYLTSYSRGQEHQADELGIRYTHRAEYDPKGMSDFLSALERNSALRNKELGIHASDMPSYFSTHPVTGERIAKTSAQAQNIDVSASENVVNRNGYLRMINGLVYGHSAKQGFVDDGVFVHPELGFTFDTPGQFFVKNNPKNIILLSKHSKAAALIDIASSKGAENVTHYVRDIWLKDKKLTNLENVSINGMAATVAQYNTQIKGENGMVRMVAIEWQPGSFFRFQLAIPQSSTVSERKALADIVSSFNVPSKAEMKKYKPKRLVSVKSSGLQSVEEVAKKMPFNDGLNVLRFRTINGLKPHETLKKGQVYKTIIQ